MSISISGGVRKVGSTGTDFSVNGPVVPIATYVLLATLAVNPIRIYCEVQNQSTSLLQLVRDDGTGANQTTIMLVGASTTPGQGGGWSSSTFQGRLRVYGPAGSPVALFQD